MGDKLHLRLHNVLQLREEHGNFKTFQFRLTQVSPISPVPFLIYVQTMLTPLSQAGVIDVSYMDYDAMLQLASSPQNTVPIFTERTNCRVEQGQTLNLSYYFVKSSFVSFYLRTSKATPRTPENLSQLSSIPVSGNTTISYIWTFCYLWVLIDHRLEMTNQSEKSWAMGNWRLDLLQTLSHNNYEITFTVAQYLIFSLLLFQILWASPVWWTWYLAVLNRLNSPL